MESFIEALDKNKKVAEKTLKDLRKRKKRSLIDPFWKNWMKEKEFYVSINKPKDILATMKGLKEENEELFDKELPSRFMIANRKRPKKKVKK